MRASVWLWKRGGALLNATDKSNSSLRITQTCDPEKIHATSHGRDEQWAVLDSWGSSWPMCGLWDGFDGGGAACCLTWWLRRINWSTKDSFMGKARGTQQQWWVHGYRIVMWIQVSIVILYRERTADLDSGYTFLYVVYGSLWRVCAIPHLALYTELTAQIHGDVCR